MGWSGLEWVGVGLVGWSGLEWVEWVGCVEWVGWVEWVGVGWSELLIKSFSEHTIHILEQFKVNFQGVNYS